MIMLLLALLLQTDVPVDLCIPAGMPLTIEIQREPGMNKLVIQRHVSPDVRAISFVQTMQIGESKGVRFSLFTIKDGLNEPASIAWADSADVRRVFIMVERVETDSGTWILGGDRAENIKRARAGDCPTAVFQVK